MIHGLTSLGNRNGTVVSCEAHGNVQANSKLSGMPDLSLNFVNAKVIDDVSFHPCVRYVLIHE